MVGEDFPYNEIVPTADGHKCSSKETDTKEPLHVETCRCQVPSSWHSSSPKYDRYREWTNMHLLGKPVGQSWEYSRYKRIVKEDKPTQHCQRKQEKMIWFLLIFTTMTQPAKSLLLYSQAGKRKMWRNLS